MARERSSRRRVRVRWGLVVLALALGVYLASARYALVVTPVATVSMGIMNGAATFHVRDDTVPGARTRPLGTGEQKRWSLYRHGYRWAWGVRGWGDFVEWARGHKRTAAPAPMPVTPGARGGNVILPLMTASPRQSTLCLLEVPLWMPLGVLAAPYLLLLVRRARRRRWQCRGCGYDLRSVAGGACPECGAERGDQRAAPSAADRASAAGLASPKSEESAPSVSPS